MAKAVPGLSQTSDRGSAAQRRCAAAPATGAQQVLYPDGLARWIIPRTGPYVASLAWAIASVALWRAIVGATDRRGIHLKR